MHSVRHHIGATQLPYRDHTFTLWFLGLDTTLDIYSIFKKENEVLVDLDEF